MKASPILKRLADLKPSSNRKAVFGIMAMVCFGVGMSLYLYALKILQDDIRAWAMIIGATQGQSDSWWVNSFGGATYVMLGGLILWAVGLLFAVSGLVRAERPRWPAIVGLVVCALPLALFLFSWASEAIKPR